MRNTIFVGLMAVAMTPAMAQMQPAQTAPGQTPPAQGDAMQAPAQTEPSATAAPATGTNTVVAGDVTPQLTAGARVFDTKGGEVGTIDEVKGAMVVISTGTAKATLANTAFARGSIGPVIAMTRTEVENAVKKAQGTPSGR